MLTTLITNGGILASKDAGVVWISGSSILLLQFSSEGSPQYTTLYNKYGYSVCCSMLCLMFQFLYLESCSVF